jgi:hypothetical protein
VSFRHSAESRAVAAYGLPGTSLRLPRAPLDDAQWDTLLGTVRRQRLSGLLHAAVVSGDLAVTDRQYEQTVRAHVDVLSSVLVLERLLVQTHDALVRADVPVRVLKGSAFAMLDYPDPSLRAFGDIDLLVRADDFDRAADVLAGLGHHRRFAQPRPGFDRRFSKGTSFETAERLEIDLHRTFTMGPFGLRLVLDRLWERSEGFVLAGRTMQALAREERFLHACYHSALGNATSRLMPMRDLAQMSLADDLDLDRVHELAAESRGEPVLARAVQMAWADLGLDDEASALSRWARGYQPDARARADLAVYAGTSSYAAKSWAAVRAIPGLADKARFLGALVAPRRSYITSRHHGPWSRLAHGLRGVVRAGWAR